MINKSEAFSILGISETSSEEEIKKAYRKKALKYHPDKNQGDKESEERFKEVVAAYELLTDKAKESIGSDSNFDFDSIFGKGEDPLSAFMNSFFSTRDTRRAVVQKRPGEVPIQLQSVDIGEYSISLEQALFRQTIYIKVRAKKACSTCLGDSSFWEECKLCGCTGKRIREIKHAMGTIQRTETCSSCSGRGWIKIKKCKECKDKLIYNKIKTVEGKLPEEFKLGYKIRLRGQGNESWKARNGDIIVSPKVIIPNLSELTIKEKDQLKYLLKKGKQ